MHDPITLSSLFTWSSLFYLIFGSLLGIIVGALPGLTATMAVALLVSLTYGLSGSHAILMLIAVYLGGIYGGSRAAILLNVPGTPSSAATALDGFPLTRMGEGAKAGVAVTTFSSLGGIVGLVILGVATPLLANLALKFGVWEYFWLAVFGVVISSNLTSGKIYKGLISGFLGMLVSCVGLDPIHGWARFTYESTSLMGGISLVPAMIGLFGMAEAFDAIRNPSSHDIEDSGGGGVDYPGRCVQLQNSLQKTGPLAEIQRDRNLDRRSPGRGAGYRLLGLVRQAPREAARKKRNSVTAAMRVSSLRRRPTTPPRPACLSPC